MAALSLYICGTSLTSAISYLFDCRGSECLVTIIMPGLKVLLRLAQLLETSQAEPALGAMGASLGS